MGPKKRPIQTTQSEEDPNDEIENSITCKDCKKTFPLKSILTHLNNARSKRKCKQKYTKQEFESLRDRCQQRSQAKHRKTVAAYADKNKESISERKATRYKANRKVILETKGQHYQANRTKILESRKIHHQVNKEKILEKKRKENKIAKDKLKSADRIKNFRQDIIDGPNFVCCSCKRELFKTGVKFLDSHDIIN